MKVSGGTVPLFLDLDTTVTEGVCSQVSMNKLLGPPQRRLEFFFGMGGWRDMCFTPVRNWTSGRSLCSLVAIDSRFRCWPAIDRNYLWEYRGLRYDCHYYDYFGYVCVCVRACVNRRRLNRMVSDRREVSSVVTSSVVAELEELR
jgi:hypothetical protein